MKIAQVSLYTLVIFSLISASSYAEKQGMEDIPSLEMLEFLGDFVANDEQWIDPMEIDELIQSADDAEEISESKE